MFNKKNNESLIFEELSFLDLEVIEDFYIIREKIRVIIALRNDNLFTIKTFKWVSDKRGINNRYSYWHDLDVTASLYDSISEARNEIDHRYRKICKK